MVNVSTMKKKSEGIGFSRAEDYGIFVNMLKNQGYSDKSVAEKLEIEELIGMKGDDIAILKQKTDGKTPLDTLIRLFLIEMPCEIEDVKKALSPLSPETLSDAGLIEIQDGIVLADIKLIPFRHLTVAFDSPRILESDIRQNYVMGIGQSSLTLANAAIQRSSGHILDLGTGCGILGLLSVKPGNKVTAVDMNPRATAFADFNARINGFDNFKSLHGDFFEPVKDQFFDLIITNPPFVISPETRYVYRDGGMPADQIVAQIIEQAPAFLKEGGFCQMICNWAEYDGIDWRDHLEKWFANTGCDAWVMRSETRSAQIYASTWIRHTEKAEPEKFEQQFAQWMDYYKSLGIDSFGAGLITMRKRSKADNWFNAQDAPPRMVGPCGQFIQRGFEIRDFLLSVASDEILLKKRFRCSPDARLIRTSAPTKNGWHDESVQLEITKGLAYSGNADYFMANVVVQCDGDVSLGNLMIKNAKELGVDPEKLKPQFCKVMRNLIEQGFILPAEIVAKSPKSDAS